MNTWICPLIQTWSQSHSPQFLLAIWWVVMCLWVVVLLVGCSAGQLVGWGIPFPWVKAFLPDPKMNVGWTKCLGTIHLKFSNLRLKISTSIYDFLTHQCCDSDWVPHHMLSTNKAFCSQWNMSAWLDIRTHGYMYTRIDAYTYTWMHGYKDTRLHIYMDTWIQEYKDTHICGYTHLYVYMDTWILKWYTFQTSAMNSQASCCWETLHYTLDQLCGGYDSSLNVNCQKALEHQNDLDHQDM